MTHDNDRAQLEQWYDDLITRLLKTNELSHSQVVANIVSNLRAIGDVLERQPKQKRVKDA